MGDGYLNVNKAFSGLQNLRLESLKPPQTTICRSRYFQHAHFIPIVGVGDRAEY